MGLREAVSPPPTGEEARGREAREPPLRPGEELVLARSGAWRILVPLRHVERILGAAMPAAIPSTTGDRDSPLVAVAEELIRVVFCQALLGAESVSLAAGDQMILVAHEGRRALLWVDAAEDLVPFDPVPPPAGGVGAPALAMAFSGRARPLAVLDVPGLIEHAHGQSNPQPEGRDRA